MEDRREKIRKAYTKMSDDMPELIDVAVDEAVSESQPIEEKKEDDDFKLVVSKRKRRQSKVEELEVDDDYYDIEQDDEPDHLKMSAESKNDILSSDTKIKFQFPPLSGDKLKV